MACNLTLGGLQPECLSNAGGVKKVWLIAHDKVKTVTFNEDKTEITGVTLDSTAKMVEYAIRKESAQLTSEFTIDDANGIKFCTNTLSLTFPRQSAAKRMEIMAMVSGDTAALVLDANGEYYLLGSEEPVTVTTASADSGKARTDANAYSVELSDFSSGYAPILTKTIAEGLI